MSAPINERGATLEEWMAFDLGLGLGEHLLPCVPYGDDVKVLEGSALKEKLGKLPSMYNRNGEAHGLKDWTTRPILSNELQLWQADRRLNICLRTGRISTIHAFDIDVDDREKAEEIVHAIEAITGPLPKRWRENSGKCTLLFRVEEK